MNPQTPIGGDLGLESLPKYIRDTDGNRLWLTLTTDITGKWNIGYATVDGAYPELYAIGGNESIDEAVTKLRDVL